MCRLIKTLPGWSASHLQISLQLSSVHRHKDGNVSSLSSVKSAPFYFKQGYCSTPLHRVHRILHIKCECVCGTTPPDHPHVLICSDRPFFCPHLWFAIIINRLLINFVDIWSFYSYLCCKWRFFTFICKIFTYGSFLNTGCGFWPNEKVTTGNLRHKMCHSIEMSESSRGSWPCQSKC